LEHDVLSKPEELTILQSMPHKSIPPRRTHLAEDYAKKVRMEPPKAYTVREASRREG
jgi:hypothetical protein